MRLPMIETQGHLIEEGKAITAGKAIPAHVRIGPDGIAVDLHVDGEEEVYVVAVSWDSIDQLSDVMAAMFAPSDFQQPADARTDLLN